MVDADPAGPAQPGRTVVFGATGHTGALTARALVARGARPLLAGRSAERLASLAAELGGLEWRQADAGRPDSVRALLQSPGDVLISTVGPFATLGQAAVRAVIAARATYLDSTGEPAFVREVFEGHGPAARAAGARLLPAQGYDYVPGALAGALALEAAGPEAVRVDVGYFAPGSGPGSLSAGTRRSLASAGAGSSFAFREGRLQAVRAAERVRSFPVAGASRAAISVGGAEHFGLPAVHPSLQEVNVYLGWFGALTRPLQVAAGLGSLAARLPGVRGALGLAGKRLAVLGGTDAPAPDGRGSSWIAAEAYDAAGRSLAALHLAGVEPYAFTARFLAWAAEAVHTQAAGARPRPGALGPLEAFGHEGLERGCAAAGISAASPPRPR